MENCGTCKNFTGKNPNYPDGFGGCRISINDRKYYDKVPENIKFYAQDFEAYYAELYVRPDFGCVMHEKKEAI